MAISYILVFILSYLYNKRHGIMTENAFYVFLMFKKDLKSEFSVDRKNACLPVHWSEYPQLEHLREKRCSDTF